MDHGQWMGRDWVQGVTHDINDADVVVARTPFGILDHVARADCDGQEGWGLFEHGSIGPAPSFWVQRLLCGRAMTLSIQEISDPPRDPRPQRRYSYALDRRDYDALDELFTPDAVLDYTATGAIRGSLREMRRSWPRPSRCSTRTQHLTTQTSIEFSDDHDTAHAKSACHNPMVVGGDNKPKMMIVGFGTSTRSCARPTVGASRTGRRNSCTRPLSTRCVNDQAARGKVRSCRASARAWVATSRSSSRSTGRRSWPAPARGQRRCRRRRGVKAAGGDAIGVQLRHHRQRVV